ncbi:MFS transporter [Sporomusa sp. KB1]|uniref:MFS transporter n=1 Tax=Sporomusa sp. KB1 TaxID=943346 RepID=UPI0011A23683|nr:MFS transporter [Sporomusa sp. KB1]TWH45666.1 sugar phosphate permease [Sporomusa sp. KB1]
MDKSMMLEKLKKYQWTMYAIICIAYMLSPFCRQAPAVMGPDLIRDLKLDAAQFGLLGLTFFWAYAIANAPAGAIIDRVGSRIGLVLSLLVTAIGSFIFSMAESLAMIVVGRMLVAVSLAGIFIAGVKIISSWFSAKQFATINGIYMGFGALGGLFATAPLQVLINQTGWRSSFVIITITCVAMAIISYLVIKSHPSDIGLPAPDELDEDTTLQIKQDSPQVHWWISTKQVLAQPRLWLIAVFALGTNATSQVIVALWGGVLLSNVYGLTKGEVAGILTYAALGAILGSIVVGWVSKKIGNAGVMLSGAVIFLLSWLYMLTNLRTLSIMELKIIYATIGFCGMYAVVGGFAVVRQLVPASQVGTAIGVCNTFAWIFGTGVFQQVWGLIINTISKGQTPYPVEAFELAMWVQAATLVVSSFCAIYLIKTLHRSESTADRTSAI